MTTLQRIFGRRNQSSDTPRPVARRTYLVVEGDNLWRIAQRKYGNPNWWFEIFTANRRLLGFRDVVHPGMTLRLP